MQDNKKSIIEHMPKYVYKGITFREVPNEVCLTLSLSSCGGNCPHCHTPELRRDIGEELNENTIKTLMDKYEKHITTICLLGSPSGIVPLCKLIKETYNVKVCVYSGEEEMLTELKPYVDFYKVGAYVHALGGLDSVNTNQRMYVLSNGEIQEDITYKFQ